MSTQTTSFFLFFLVILITIPSAYAWTTTVTAELLPEDQVIIEDEVILDNNTTLDVSENVQAIPTQTETIGGETVVLKEGYKFNTSQGDDVILENTDLPTAIVIIPDNTIVKAPTTWNGEITPPKTVTTSGTVTGNFLTPTSSILIGSPDVILVFDTSVTITLTGTTGQIAYKNPGASVWILIDTCTGTFESPNDPPTNGECSITDGTDTKILTFHFTEFTGLTTPTASSSNTGGSGRTGVGPSSGSGSSRGGGSIITYLPETINVIPAWVTIPVGWWHDDTITDSEFKGIITHLLDSNIIPTDTPMLSQPLIDLAPSMKHLFSMWADDKLPESSIIGLIHYYRDTGVW